MATTADRRLANDLLGGVTHLRRALRHRWHDVQQHEPLSGSQAELMAVVDSHPQVTVNEAAASLHLAANTVSTVVSQLARKGLVERCADPEDARLTRLRLTRTGRARRVASRDYREQALAVSISRLTVRDRMVLDAAIPVLHLLLADLGEVDDAGHGQVWRPKASRA